MIRTAIALFAPPIFDEWFGITMRTILPQLSSEATMMTLDPSGSLTAGSRGRSKPFSTMPATANGRLRCPRCASIGDATASGGKSRGASGGSAAICSSRARRSALRRSAPGVVVAHSSQYAVRTKEAEKESGPPLFPREPKTRSPDPFLRPVKLNRQRDCRNDT